MKWRTIGEEKTALIKKDRKPQTGGGGVQWGTGGEQDRKIAGDAQKKKTKT